MWFMSTVLNLIIRLRFFFVDKNSFSDLSIDFRFRILFDFIHIFDVCQIEPTLQMTLELDNPLISISSHFFYAYRDWVKFSIYKTFIVGRLKLACDLTSQLGSGLKKTELENASFCMLKTVHSRALVFFVSRWAASVYLLPTADYMSRLNTLSSQHFLSGRKAFFLIHYEKMLMIV